jgi:diguanylate cyclase
LDQKLNSHLRAITGSTTDAIIATDSNGIILSWNRAAEIIFQYKSDEMVGQSLLEIIPKRFRNAHEKGMERVTQGHSPKVIGTVVELFGLRKNGQEFPIELSLSTWTTNEGKFYGGIIRDISERKKVEN